MKKQIVKRAVVPVPVSLDEASEFIRTIGDRKRQVEEIERKLNTKLDELKTQAAAQIQPLNDEIEEQIDGLFAFAETNRAALTNDGKTKTVKLNTGTISWRITPPKVLISNSDKVLKVLKTLGLSRFIRTAEEPNKQAMLEEAEIAKTVKGVRIDQHEEFIIKPDQWEAEIVSRADKLSKKVVS